MKELDLSKEKMERLLAVDKDEWQKEIKNIEEFFKKFGDDLPKEMTKELGDLKKRLGK